MIRTIDEDDATNAKLTREQWRAICCPRCRKHYRDHGRPEQTGDGKGRVYQCPNCGKVVNR